MSKEKPINPRRTVFLASLSIVIFLIFLSLSNMTAFSDEHRYRVERSSFHSYGSSFVCDKEANVGYALNATAGQAEAGNRLQTKVYQIDGGFEANRSARPAKDCPDQTTGSPTTIFLPTVIK